MAATPSQHRATERRDEVGAGEGFLLGGVMLVLGLALRIGYVFHHRVNLDETEHLHVAWGWAHGLLPYRDIFDNHAPVFSVLMAPLIGALGERPDIVLFARWAMLPLVGLTLAMTWLVGRRLYSASVALWAVAIAAVIPDFLLASVEYRADQLWAACWLATLAVLLSDRLTRTRSFAAGVLLGLTFAVSLKTSLLVISLATAATAAAVMLKQRGVRLRVRWIVGRAALAALGVVLVPGWVMIYFAARGLWAPFLYNTVGHNLVSGLGLWHKAPFRVLLIPASAPLMWIIARQIVDRAPDFGTGARRAVLFLTAAGYIVTLQGFWPLITREDIMPFAPMVALVATPWLPGFLATWIADANDRAQLARGLRNAAVLVVVAEMTWVLAAEPVWRDELEPEVGFVREVLRLTHTGEPVMDMRGEAVFRLRPFYYALESITLERIKLGLLRDGIAERLVATRTPAAVLDNYELPEPSRSFLNANYLPVGPLRVAGEFLGAADSADARRFEIRVPQRYAMVCEGGPATGLLDGMAYRGPRDLAAGWHSYQAGSSEGRTAVIWAGAVARGASPFR